MYHILCIHSSVEGHLGCFQLVAIINKVAMNIVEHVSILLVGASSGYIPRSGIAGSSLVLFPFFRRIARLISRVIVQLVIPPPVEECYSFSTFSPATAVTWVFLSQPFWQVWCGISGLFWFSIPWWLRTWNISLGASQPCSIPQLRILWLPMYTLFYIVIWFSGVFFLSSLYILDISPLSDVGLVKSFPNLFIAFFPIDSVLCLTEAV